VLFHEGTAYVPSATGFPPGNNWNVRAVEDGWATLRISGARYPVLLTRVTDETQIAALGAADLTKYPGGPPPQGRHLVFRGGEPYAVSAADLPRRSRRSGSATH
jgi:hypothetical protein